jgi:hypothetical protein
MANVITNSGRNVTEEILVGTSTATVDTVAVGDGTSSPSETDTSMYGQLYEASDASANVTVGKTSVTGQIRFTITVTGGTEVPSETELTEFGIKTSSGELLYHEVRSTAITVASGESKTIELLLTVADDVVSSNTVLTDAGLDHIADLLVGNKTTRMDTIAVGSSKNSSGIDQSNTSMFDEVYRSDDSVPHVIVDETSSDGSVEAKITLSAGNDSDDEVAANTSISEFGLLTSDGVLIIHEIRDEVVLQNNDTKTFTIPLNIVT